MVCYKCGGETEVFNSRNQKRNNQIWRRRKCKTCNFSFTTHEAIYLPALFNVSRGEAVEPFTPDMLLGELMIVLRDKPRPYEAARELCATITRNVLKNASDGLILAPSISFEAGKALKRFNRQAWLRYMAEHPSLQV